MNAFQKDKTKVFIALLTLEFAVVSTVITLSFKGIGNLPSKGLGFSVIAYPFERLCYFLRSLSESGFLGNTIAWIIFLGLSLIPTFIYYFLKRGGSTLKSDRVLPLLSLCIFLCFYFGINGGLLNFSNGYSLYLGAVLTMLSAIIGFFILRISEIGAKGDFSYKLKLLRKILILSTFLIVFFNGVNFSLGFISSFREGFSDIWVAIISLAYTAIIVGIMLIAAEGVDRSDDMNIDEILRITRILCRLATFGLILMAIGIFVMNAVQLLAGDKISDLHFMATIPFENLIIMMIIRLAGEAAKKFVEIKAERERMSREVKKLEEENQLFI